MCLPLLFTTPKIAKRGIVGLRSALLTCVRCFEYDDCCQNQIQANDWRGYSD